MYNNNTSRSRRRHRIDLYANIERECVWDSAPHLTLLVVLAERIYDLFASCETNTLNYTTLKHNIWFMCSWVDLFARVFLKVGIARYLHGANIFVNLTIQIRLNNLIERHSYNSLRHSPDTASTVSTAINQNWSVNESPSYIVRINKYKSKLMLH